MPRPDFTSPRLFVSAPLSAGASIPLEREQINYLVNVLRLEGGATVLVFNDRDGEWRAVLALSGKRNATLTAGEQTRPQPPRSRLFYAFAPLKHARLDYMVQKAVEMGAGVLQPVITRRTQVARVNHERMVANAIEAAEQCGVLCVPEIRPVRPLADWLADWPDENGLVFCDEDAAVGGTLETLVQARDESARGIALLIGPEGGFDEYERRTLAARPGVRRVSLGPRFLRADTAAVAALAVIQATIGDWLPPGSLSDG